MSTKTDTAGKKKPSTFDALRRLKAAFLTQDEEGFNKELDNVSNNMDSDPKDKDEGAKGGDVHVHIHGSGASTEAPPGAAAAKPDPDSDPTGAQTAATAKDAGEGAAEAGAEGEQAPAWFVKHVEQNNARFSAIEKKLGLTTDEGAITGKDPVPGATGDEGAITGKDPVPGATGDEDPEKKDGEKKGTMDAATMDSKGLNSEFSDTLSRAEIIAPGITFPTFDSKALATKTNDTLCALRRRALDTYVSTQDGASVVAPFVGGKKTGMKFTGNKNFTCDSVRSIFIGVSEVKKRENNAAGKPTLDTRGSSVASDPRSINERNREFWAPKV